MKLLFVTNALEPGSGGVEDYTRLLASSCAERGHEVAMLALSDLAIQGRAGTCVDENGIRTLRVRSFVDDGEDRRTAADFVNTFAPDGVSLQFVSYGFHPRGFCWSAVGALSDVLGKTPVQLMLHELWLGGERGASLRNRLIGWLQRHCVLRLFSKLNVRSTLTSNRAYAELLKKRGIAARVLPLFGAIPVLAGRPQMQRVTLWKFLLFGTLHPTWPPEPLFTYLRALGVGVEIIHAGRIGAGEALWEKMQRDYAGALAFRRVGELPPEPLADIFCEADFGIATTPWDIIGKSGSVAAMLDYGLPVIVNREDVSYPGASDGAALDSLLIRMDDRLPERLAVAQRRSPRISLPLIADQFLAEWEVVLN